MIGERIAEQYLRERGYRILAKNVRMHRCEIDIVAYDQQAGMVVFAEVKTRHRYSSAYPVYTAVDRRKRMALRRAVDMWVTQHDYSGPARIDIVCVGGGRVCNHIYDMGSEFFVDL